MRRHIVRLLLTGVVLIASSLRAGSVDANFEKFLPPGATGVASGECTLSTPDGEPIHPMGECTPRAYVNFNMGPSGGSVGITVSFAGSLPYTTHRFPEDHPNWMVSGFLDITVQYSTEFMILGGTGDGVVHTEFGTTVGHSGISETTSIDYALSTTFGDPDSGGAFPFTFGELYTYNVSVHLRVHAIEPDAPFRLTISTSSSLPSILDANGEVIEGAYIAECPCEVATPEPEAWLMLSAGLLALAALRKRSRALRLP
jgi:hypothetical protein